jgi:hypothetical protein
MSALLGGTMSKLLSRVLATLAVSAILSACAPNFVKPGVFWNTVSLIDGEGNIATGRVVLNAFTRDGDIEIPNTRYGNLTGKFATQSQELRSQSLGIGAVMSSNQTILVPTLGTTAMTSTNSYGQAYLTSSGKVVLKCSIGVDFKHDSWEGSVYAIGAGVCSDKDKNTVHLQFTR